MLKPFIFILFIVSSLFIQNGSSGKVEATITSDELKLYDLIMQYRKEKKLPTIPLSVSLTYVAQQHVNDLLMNKPDLKSGCNAHSWSDKGKWTACCYTADHKQAACMWSKPKELTTYTDHGFEIACGSSDPVYEKFVMTPEYALSSWKKSPGHNSVIVNLGKWANYDWKAIGIGMNKGFAVVWFGKSPDAAGEPTR